ncbi:MAG: VWA domain-containing protein, partial [Actinobacteria bacterium]|nr:VWA domain-containing protein [Actinomycetota bacterium]
MKRLATLLIALLLSSPGAAFAAESVQIQSAQVKGGSLTLDVSTPGGPLLDREAFHVTVNDLPVEELVARPIGGRAGASGAVLLVDVSGSMKGRPMSDAIGAVQIFLDGLQAEDEVALVTFADDVRVVSDYTADHEAVAEAVADLRPAGETALYDGLLAALELAEDRPQQQRNVIVLSDGGDTASRAGLSSVLNGVAVEEAAIYAVALKSDEYSPATLARVADVSGGRILETSDSAKLVALFQDLVGMLASRYELRFEHPDPEALLAEIDVEVDSSSGSVTGSRSFVLGQPGGVGEAARSPRDLTALISLLVLVFASGFALIGAFMGEVGKRRSSPAQRVAWYETGSSGEPLSEDLINAAILQRAKDLATSLASRAGYLERIEREVDAAGMRWRAGEIIVASFLIGMAGAFLGWVLMGWILGLAVGILGTVAPTLTVKYKAGARRREFRKQLSDVLLVMSGALRAGYSLQQAIQAVGDDARPPASEEFRRTMAEVRLGASLDDALNALSHRIGIVDFEWTV